MLHTVNDLRVMGEGFKFKTSLPKSFVALLVSSLGKLGVTVKDIRDKDGVREITTSHGVVKMKGTFSVADVKNRLLCGIYGVLNERFDSRVAQLRAKGLHYYKEHTCFAKSECSASNGSGIPNAAIMHMDDFMFNMKLETL